MGKGLSYLKKWGIWVNYSWNYGPSKLLLRFIEYRLDQLNNKHTKIAVNSAIQIQIWNILCIFIKPNVWYSWRLKILAIKRWCLFNFAKTLQGRHFVVGGSKSFKHLAEFILRTALKILYYRVYCYFCVVVIKLI